MDKSQIASASLFLALEYSSKTAPVKCTAQNLLILTEKNGNSWS